MHNFSIPRTFLSKNRHSSTTSEDLSNRWGLSISQAEVNLKETTNKLTRSALMPLARRYIDNRMFDVRRIHGTMSTYTMDSRCQSIHNEQYCQVFGNKKIFVDVYPIKNKYYWNLGLDKVIQDDLRWCTTKIGRKTEFQRLMRKYEI